MSCLWSICLSSVCLFCKPRMLSCRMFRCVLLEVFEFPVANLSQAVLEVTAMRRPFSKRRLSSYEEFFGFPGISDCWGFPEAFMLCPRFLRKFSVSFNSRFVEVEG